MDLPEICCFLLCGASASLLVAASWDPYSLVESAVASAANLSGGGQPLSSKEVPGTVDFFGWCTWDAFYSRVAAQGDCQSAVPLCLEIFGYVTFYSI
eukprot:scaffold648010_cov47-Prasinocladus_malaysianus.AAC.4